MNLPRTHFLLAAASLALNGAMMIAWGLSPWLPAAFIPGPVVAIGIGLALSVTVIGVIGRQLWREQQTVLRNLELLTQIDRRRVSDGPPAGLPAISESSPWSGVCRKVRERLSDLASALQEAEHSRESLEVRLRRVTGQHERVEAILQTLAEPVIAVDGYDELLLANHSAAQLFDLEPQSTERRALSAVIRCQALVELLSETGRRKVPTSRTSEIELTDHTGATRSFRITANSLVSGQASEGSGQSGPQGAVAVLQDITSHKGTHKRHAEFVSSVSHEMKAPLAGIKAYVEMLLDGDAEDDKTREEFLNVISNQANRLQRLVENLLNLARIEAGVVHVDKLHHSLNELLGEAVEVMQPSAVEKRIDLQTDLSSMYLGVLVDRDMLLQAAINLLSNAIKYTPPAGRVKLRSRLRDEKVEFSIEDTGVGLSEEDCTRVFQKFYRVAKDREMAPGTGLGLPLVKSIVEEVLGGAISVESQPGVGSTFIVTLPSAGQLGQASPLNRSVQESVP